MNQPKLFLCLRDYNRSDLTHDLTAGITVGLVALPLAMAFAIASGVKPEAGIYTAVIAGFIISALGGSSVQIGGPTGAFVVIVAGIVARFGLSGLMMVTLMAGALLVIMGLTGLGRAVEFIPRPVTIGFTNGIAVLIASTQIKDFLGLNTGAGEVPSAFLPRMKLLVASAATVDLPTTAVAAASLVLILLWPRVTKRIPGTIVALVAATVATQLFHLPVATIGTRFGGIPTGLPHFHIPEFRFDLIPMLAPSALTVALLGAIESLLSAVVGDNLSGGQHDSNTELVAQGVANLASPLFGGIPATGAIARTATNIRSGARTPVAGIVHALTLLFILLVAAPLARFVPLATLAAVLLVVAYNMGEWREIGYIMRLARTAIAVWGVTFLLTVFADLTVAVEFGIVLAALLYIYRISETTTVSLVTDDYLQAGGPHVLQGKSIPDYVTIVRIHGPFLFGSTAKLTEATADMNAFAPIVILRLRNMTALDVTGLHAIESFADRLHSSGREILICGARNQPATLIERSDLYEHVGKESVLPHVEAALARAREIMAARRNAS
ncbi:MAG: STAS domain-containing protein [Candidatus Solibacter usitatus]|nr:STAS domain-containing protein [Candidatus Solibacter usitatus]